MWNHFCVLILLLQTYAASHMYRCISLLQEFFAFRQLYADISKIGLCALDVHKMLVLKLLELHNKMKVFL